jgi:hypothetical protein
MIVKIFRNTKHGVVKITLDEQGLELYQKYSWHIQKHGNTYYLKTNLKVDGKYYSRTFHRELFNLDNPNNVIDHINGDGLDNRRVNCRVCTQQDNIRNQVRKYVSNKTSKYKGVFWNKKSKTWRAMIGVNNKRINIGSFSSEHAAGIAYNILAKKHYSDFARLNKIRKGA